MSERIQVRMDGREERMECMEGDENWWMKDDWQATSVGDE